MSYKIADSNENIITIPCICESVVIYFAMGYGS